MHTLSDPALFRCCGKPKTPANTGYRLLLGKRYPYCLSCRNRRERIYRKMHREQVNAGEVRHRLRKNGLPVPPPLPIPRDDQLRLAGLQADLIALSAAVDATAAEERVFTAACLEHLRAAYELGAARAQQTSRREHDV